MMQASAVNADQPKGTQKAGRVVRSMDLTPHQKAFDEFRYCRMRVAKDGDRYALMGAIASVEIPADVVRPLEGLPFVSIRVNATFLGLPVSAITVTTLGLTGPRDAIWQSLGDNKEVLYGNEYQLRINANVERARKAVEVAWNERFVPGGQEGPYTFPDVVSYQTVQRLPIRVTLESDPTNRGITVLRYICQLTGAQ